MEFGTASLALLSHKCCLDLLAPQTGSWPSLSPSATIKHSVEMGGQAQEEASCFFFFFSFFGGGWNTREAQHMTLMLLRDGYKCRPDARLCQHRSIAL